MKKLLVIFLFALSSASYGQGRTQQANDSLLYIQLTGIVITDSLYRVPFTRVGDINTRRGTLADFYGYFALVVHPGDTVQFSC